MTDSPRRPWPAVLLALAALLGGCAAARHPAPGGADLAYGGALLAYPSADDDSDADDADDEDEEDDDGHGILVTILLYLPNRVLDLLDVARFGVDVGPGIGVHLQATDGLQLKAIAATSAGVGYQTLRHLPVHAGTRSGAGAGPVEGSAEIWDWYQSPGDIRVELYVLLVGAHVAVEVFEIADAVLGFVFIDLVGDDL